MCIHSAIQSNINIECAGITVLWFSLRTQMTAVTVVIYISRINFIIVNMNSEQFIHSIYGCVCVQ